MDSPSRAVPEPELLANLAWVQALARGLVADAATAEDVAQDTWLAALERPPRRTSGAGLRAWLRQVVRTMARQSARSAASRGKRERSVARPEAEPSAFDVVGRAATQQRIVDAVMALDEPERTTVLLRYLDGLSASAIAELRGETSAAVRQRLSRARETLRARLARELDADRRDLIHALAPVAFVGGWKTTPAGLGKLIGGALVSKTSVAIGVAAVVVIVGAVAWWPRGEDPVPRETPEKASVVTEATPSAGGEAEVAEVSLLPPEVEPTDPARTSVPVEESPSGAVYELLEPEGAPVPGAHVVLVRDGEVLALGETDERGQLATELQLEGSGKLLVLARGWTPQIHEVSLAPALHEVPLRPGAIVAGWIVVNGYRLSTAIPLELRSDRTLLDLTSELGITEEEAEIDRMASRVMRGSTDARGAFRFDGLAEDWSGILELPVDYRLADPTLATNDSRPCSIHLERPVQDLRVDVVKSLVLMGRVVEVHKAEPVPVPDADVESRIKYPGVDPDLTYQGSERTDELGRFRIAVRNPTIQGGHLRISPPDRSFLRDIEIEPRELQADWDLGDLALCDRDAISQVHLLVRNKAGDPISGAVAGTDSSNPHSAPTDEEGRTTLRGVVPGLSTIVVYGMGYEIATIEVPAEPPEEIEVTMRRGTLLDIRFLTPNGEPANFVKARLAADRNPLQNERRWPRAFKAYTEAGYSGFRPGYTEDGTWVIRLQALRDGGVIVNDVVPGLPLHLRVDGQYGTPIQEQTIAPLGPEEHRRIEVVLVEGAKTVRGRVLNEAGEPIPHASVGVFHVAPDSRPGSSQGSGGSVEDDGSFEIPYVYATHIHINADADGYVPFRDREYEVPVDGEELVVRLAKGHVVTVVLEEECGKRQTGQVWSDLPNGAGAYGQKVEGETGVYLVRGLPDEEVTIQARVYWTVHERVHDPLVPNLTITIPTLGEVEATVRRFGDLELDGECGLWILPVDDEGLRRRYAELEQDFTNPVRIPGVLPGRYEAVVQRYLGGYYEEARFDELSPRIPIVILPGEPTRFEVWP